LRRNLVPARVAPQLNAVRRVHSCVVVFWRVLLGLYVAAALVALVIVNADQGDWRPALGIVGLAALALGWGTASAWGAVVAWLMVPFALVFGEANQNSGMGETDAVVLLAVAAAAISTALIVLAAGARHLFNRLQSRARPVDASASLGNEAPPPGTVSLGPPHRR
jgi:hypothetical protein